MTPNQHDDLKAVREHVRKCFDSVSCYLMPSPGTKVQSGDSDGRLAGVLNSVHVWEGEGEKEINGETTYQLFYS